MVIVGTGRICDGLVITVAAILFYIDMKTVEKPCNLKQRFKQNNK